MNTKCNKSHHSIFTQELATVVLALVCTRIDFGNTIYTGSSSLHCMLLPKGWIELEEK